MKLIVKVFNYKIMNLDKITTRKEYEKIMKEIESLLQKAIKKGDFEKLTKLDKANLSRLSVMAEQFEDDIPLMPMKA